MNSKEKELAGRGWIERLSCPARCCWRCDRGGRWLCPAAVGKGTTSLTAAGLQTLNECLPQSRCHTAELIDSKFLWCI